MLFLKYRSIAQLIRRHNQHVGTNLHNLAGACEVLSVFCKEDLKKVTALRLAAAGCAAARAAVVMAMQGCLATEIAGFFPEMCERR